jgi:peptide/nickel transport system permease protein
VVGYVFRRILSTVPVLLGVSILIFSFIHMIPGDPAQAMLGERATPESLARIRTSLGLDKPIWEQYLIYMGKVLRGDLGTSILRQDPVTQQLLTRFPATVELSVTAMLLALLFGIPAGVFSAVKRNSWFDNGTMLLSLAGVSMPIFWLGLMMQTLFSVILHWFPTSAQLTATLEFKSPTHFVLIDAIAQGNGVVLVDYLHHLVMPAFALSTIPLATIARMTRSSMLDVLGQDYVRTAWAKGLRFSTVVLKHALRNALLPIVTVGGLLVGRLMAGAILTETVFSWPGIGRWLFDSIGARDYPIVQGVTLFVTSVIVLVNLLVDISYGLLDPRIRLQ